MPGRRTEVLDIELSQEELPERAVHLESCRFEPVVEANEHARPEILGSHLGGKRARLADIEAQLDRSGHFVDVLAARTGSANKGYCQFGIWNKYRQMLLPE